MGFAAPNVRSDNSCGDGRNWLGMQLMLIRDELNAGSDGSGQALIVCTLLELLIFSAICRAQAVLKGLPKEGHWKVGIGKRGGLLAKGSFRNCPCSIGSNGNSAMWTSKTRKMQRMRMTGLKMILGLEKGMLFLAEGSFRKVRFYVSRAPQSVENKGESENFLEILEYLEIFETKDFSSQNTPFIMTPSSGPEKGATRKEQPKISRR